MPFLLFLIEFFECSPLLSILFTAFIEFKDNCIMFFLAWQLRVAEEMEPLAKTFFDELLVLSIKEFS
jgi:hypothetical protein